MFTSIIKFFQKKKKSTEELFEFPETLILESTNKNIGEIKRYVGKKINIELTPQLKNNLIYHYRKFKVL